MPDTPTQEPLLHTRTAPDEPFTGTPPFESWGRYPRFNATVKELHWQSDFPRIIDGVHEGALAVGMGRSYGDVGLLKDGTLVHTTSMNRLLHWDPETGVLTAEAGITLAQILDFAVPRGFFLPVTPGTKFVTLGGAIANDVHGKNHEAAGSFGNHVPRFELVRSDGTRLLCSATENPDLFAATIGGMGLTGVIVWAQLRLKPIVSRMIDYEGIQFHGIDEFLDIKKAYPNVEYTVSWLDCVSQGKNFARGIYMLGDHSKDPGELKPSGKPKLTFPIEAPGFMLNKLSISAFNTVFFHKQMKKHVITKQDYEPFFYPLDAVHKWNRMYGKRGLVQFQFALPWETSKEGTIAMLQEITKSGLASFLAVLKTFGDVPSLGMMSFPMPGFMFALDFPIKDITFPLMQRLGDMTKDYGGRLYPAKDACMTPEQFRAYYPQFERFARYKDPAITSSFWERVAGGSR
ncbi:FAD-binding protein [Granulicella cerasi]|uniref:FAD-binding protein n=1 Tax=Granulicella cerasi TaxID=741063 RepID=A0ABW1ZBM9_9BACT|nr:FAD-binding oxidoreductase [Granulicella cerasi]